MGNTPCERGASLLETLVALGVASILVTTAAPWFSGIVTDVRRSSETNELLADLALARADAVRSGHRVVLCVSGDQATCASSGQWSQGRIVFQDLNNNAQRDDGERIVVVRESIAPDWVIKGNASVASYVSYHPVGRSRLVNGAFQAGTLTICPASDVPIKGAEIVISSAGRARSQPTALSVCR